MTAAGSLQAWAAVVALGAFHGANPSMGWLFAVSNAMFARRARAIFEALPPIALGHLLSMAAVLLPVAAIAALSTQLALVRIVAGVAIIVFGIYKLVVRRHPRVLSRIGAGHLTLWSFVMASAHGAGLMLVPIYLGMAPMKGEPSMPGMAAMGQVGNGIAVAAAVAVVHTVAMLAVAAAIAWVFFR
ncbi:MAG TPA: hypothetical protein VEJ20_06195, partial [Candidatus Eremiobacteraceae bacterium]|nr:hypothetical protein [Candidatus Eremiobacteraceae bacterium]